MSRRWKNFWIMCGVLAGVGLLLLIGGTILGGISILQSGESNRVIQRWMERLDLGENEDIIVTYDDTSDQTDSTTVKMYQGVSKIDINLDAVAVKINACEGDKLIVDTSQVRKDIAEVIQVNQDDGELEIEADHHTGYHTNDTGVLYVSVPEQDRADIINAETSAGIITISDTETKKIHLKTEAGQITAENIKTEQMKTECGAGKISVSGTVTNEADIECGMGEIICILTGKVSDYKYDVSCDIGEVNIDGETYEGLQKNIHHGTGAGAVIKADCNMGKIEIGFNQS